jgi:hypothetical protein
MSKKTSKYQKFINNIKHKVNKDFAKNELNKTQIIIAVFVSIILIIIILNLIN